MWGVSFIATVFHCSDDEPMIITMLISIYLRTQAPGLVGGDDHVGGDEECSVLSGRNDVVCLVPHSLVHSLKQNTASCGAIHGILFFQVTTEKACAIAIEMPVKL